MSETTNKNGQNTDKILTPDYTKLIESIREKISLNKIKQLSTGISTKETELLNYYKEIQNDLKSLSDNYSEINTLENNIGSLLAVIILISLYMKDFDMAADEYNNLSKFISMILSDNSEIMILLKLIEQHYQIYSTTLYEDVKASEAVTINNLLLELLELLKPVLIQLGILPSDFKITKNDSDYDGSVTLSSDTYRSFQSNSSITNHAWYGKIDKSGWVGQSSDIFIQQQDGNSQNDLLVSMPVLEVNNVTYKYDSKTILWLFNLHNYTGTLRVENDGSDPENNNPYKLITTELRCGNLFSGNSTVVKKDMPIKFVYDSTGGNSSVSNGSVDYYGTYTSDNMSIEFNFNEGYSKELYPSTKLSDSITINRTITFSPAESTGETINYSLSGDLNYNEELTNNHINELQEIYGFENSENGTKVDENLYDSRNITYYSGNVTIKNTSIDYDSLSDQEKAEVDAGSGQMSKTVVVEIAENPDGTYDLKCYSDPENSTSSVVITENNDNISAFFAIQFEYKDLTMDTDIVINSPELEAAQALLGIGSLTAEEDNFDYKYARLKTIIDSVKSLLTQSLTDAIQDLSSLIETIIMVESDMANATTIETSYIQDILTSISSLSTDFDKYLTTDSYNIEELYDGTLYNKIINASSKTREQIISVLEDIRNTIIKLNNLDEKVLQITDKTNNSSWAISGALSKLNELLSGQSTFSVALSVLGKSITTFKTKSFNDWRNSLIPTESVGNIMNILALSHVRDIFSGTDIEDYSNKEFYDFLAETTSVVGGIGMDTISSGINYYDIDYYAINNFIEETLLKYKTDTSTEYISYSNTIPSFYYTMFYLCFVAKYALKETFNDNNSDYYKAYDQIENDLTVDLINNDFVQIYNYESVDNYMNLNYLYKYKGNDNADFISPSLLKQFPEFKLMDSVEIEDSINSGNVKTLYLSIIYKAILSVPADKLDENISNFIDLIKNKSKVNFREAVLISEALYAFSVILNQIENVGALLVMSKTRESTLKYLSKIYENELYTYIKFKTNIKNKNIKTIFSTQVL